MRRNGLLSRLFTILVFVFLYAPIFLLVIFSFNATKSNRVWGGFSLRWYLELFDDSRILGALQTTLLLSVSAAILATILGTAAAFGFYAMKRRTRNLCLAVNNIPLTNADIITGVSMMLLFVFAINAFNATIGGTLGIKWRMGFMTLLIAHVTFDAPYVILSVLPKLRQLDPNLYEAAQDLGAPGFLAFRKVVLPEILPGVLNGLMIAFTMSIDDFVISYFTKGPGVNVLAVEIYTMVKKPVTPEINALFTLMFVFLLILLAIINLRQSRQERLERKRRSALTPRQ